MATLYGLGCCEGLSAYVMTKRRRYTDEEWSQIKQELSESSTIYVGNLSFFTTEDQLYELFLMIGPIKSVIMGLNAKTKEPCGFAFVQFYAHDHAKAAVDYMFGHI
jgi:nuclear cap-binding protein subunit 2